MASPELLELARRATAIYEQKYRAALEAQFLHQFVAIEPDSEAYFLGQTMSEAVQASRAIYPDRKPFVLRVGHAATVHLGVLTS